MSLPPILNRALKAAYEGANEIIHFSKQIDNLKIIEKGDNDFTTNLDKYAEIKVFDYLNNTIQTLVILEKRVLMGLSKKKS